MRVCYIAGPFRSSDHAQRAAHVLTAQAAAVDLARIGFAPYCPHANLGHAFGAIDERVATEVNTAFLRLCDAFLLLPGWGESLGTRAELEEARRLGLPVFESIQEVRAWRQR